VAETSGDAMLSSDCACLSSVDADTLNKQQPCCCHQWCCLRCRWCSSLADNCCSAAAASSACLTGRCVEGICQCLQHLQLLALQRRQLCLQAAGHTQTHPYVNDDRD
jgi:hypothetical protein